ncbi:arsenic transporter [Nocardioides mangrovicus]|uniref:Arsenic transporter n=1 Tax=Nocardioides mangrovicus TaxID=2478913 RepID=A0A3L8P721_9ACTN|nr:SLC13 family permease [Nocardioides mangrovicus]RLV50787.1 arsenic transporter [Nocardioides mangrovicus]
MADVVPLVALAALLAVAFVHPPWWVELGVAVAGTVAVVATSATSWHLAADAAGRMLPVVVFLVAILAVAGACAELGLFRAIGERIGRPGTGPQGFLALTFVAAVAVTAVLSLDATVVLLTLVVLAAAGHAGVRPAPGLSACVRLANSSSLLLPVSNLTTLLATHHLDLSFGRFALVMAPAWLGVIAVEYAVHRVFFRRDLAAAPTPDDDPTPPHPLPTFPLTVVVLMLVGFALTSLVGIGAAWGAAWVSVAAALVLLLPAARVRRAVPVLQATQPAFAAFVLGLAVVVDAVGRGPVGDLVDRAIPAGGHHLGQLLWLALLATVVANVLNNLPATLLLVPLVAPLGTEAVLATLVGLNVGSSLTWTGSLANLLWRRTLGAAGSVPSSRSFHAVSVVAAPLGVVVGVVLVWAWAPVSL